MSKEQNRNVWVKLGIDIKVTDEEYAELYAGSDGGDYNEDLPDWLLDRVMEHVNKTRLRKDYSCIPDTSWEDD